MFWWRRKITIDGISIPIDLPLHTANFYQARAIVDRLGSALEELRVAYGERGRGIDPTTLKQIFQDAMRWQLDRIRQDQIGSTVPASPAHEQINRVYAEFWRHYARQGAGVPWTDEDEARLIREDWTLDEIALLKREAARHSGALVSLSQLETYASHFGFVLTPANRDQVQQVVFSARAAACDTATSELGQEPGDLGHWVEDALASGDSFLFEKPPAGAVTTAEPCWPSRRLPLYQRIMLPGSNSWGRPLHPKAPLIPQRSCSTPRWRRASPPT